MRIVEIISTHQRGKKMSVILSTMRISSATVALRIRENQIETLQTKLNDIVLNRAYPLDMGELLQCIQVALTNRLGYIDADEREHKNIQLEIDVLEAIINAHKLDHENDGPGERSRRLNQIRQALLVTSITK